MEAVLIPKREVRFFGDLSSVIRDELGLDVPEDKSVLFVHPLSKNLYKSIIKKYGLFETNIAVTPTSSYRSLLAGRMDGPSRTPLILKLSLAAKLAGAFRVNSEGHVIRAIIVSAMLAEIPRAAREINGFDFFPETAALTQDVGNHKNAAIGYIVRRFPASFRCRGSNTLAPMFSLISRQSSGSRDDKEEVPILVRCIQRSRQAPETYLIEKVILPYVRALGYLLFEEGLTVECHTQNLLYELDAAGELTGKVVLRDLTGMRINIGLRLARGKRFPICPGSPASSKHLVRLFMGVSERRSASFFIERLGLKGTIWALAHSLRRYFPHLDHAELKSAYLQLWQQAAVHSLSLRPLLKRGLSGLAMDEAIDFYLSNFDWTPVMRAASKNTARDVVSLLRSTRKRSNRPGRRGFVDIEWGQVIADGKGGLLFSR